MMHAARFISVLFSLLAIGTVLLVGFPGCDRGGIPFDETTALYSKVSGERAFQHVKTMVEIGPRPAGSEALEKTRVFLTDELEKSGWKVERQSFPKMTPEGKVEFVNLRARFGEDADFSKKVTGLVCSHYETKKFSFKFVGANDAGSSTGLLLELANVLSQKPAIARRLELVFFDGEEAFGPNITTTDGLYGSKYYAAQKVLLPKAKRPDWGIVLDMVGDKDLNIRAAVQIPNASIQALKKAGEAGHLVDIEKVKQKVEQMSRHLLSAADDLDVRSKIGISSQFITDDHIPLNTGAGIPSIDLIDFDYGNYWHTPGDTLDKISAESLEIVGRVTLLLIEKYLLN